MAWAFIHLLVPYLNSIYGVVGYIVFPGEEVVGECYYKRGHSKSELKFLRSIVTKSRVIYMSAGLIL